MRRAMVFAALTAACVVPPGFADVDVSAHSIQFEVVEGELRVNATYGVWHDEAQADYTIHVELVQLRDGVPIATVWQDSHSGLISSSVSSCKRGCHVQSCTGTCSVGGKSGSCRTKAENCDGKDGYRECMSVLESGAIALQGVHDGDIFRLSVEVSGATDMNSANDTLTVAFN